MTWQPKSSLTVETSHWTSSNMDSVPLHSSSRLWDLVFQMKCKIYFNLKRRLWTTEFFVSTAQVRFFWRCLCFRSGLVALFLKTSERGDSWCTDSSFSPLLVKLSQVFESVLLDSILKLAVIPVACAPFPTQILTVGMVINWNSNVNILIFWDTDFWLSWAVSSNHQN